MILILYISNTLHIWNEVFSYHLKICLFSVGYFMVWTDVVLTSSAMTLTTIPGGGGDEYTTLTYFSLKI